MDKTFLHSIFQMKPGKKAGQEDTLRNCLSQVPGAFYIFFSANFHDATILDISRSNCSET